MRAFEDARDRAAACAPEQIKFWGAAHKDMLAAARYHSTSTAREFMTLMLAAAESFFAELPELVPAEPEPEEPAELEDDDDEFDEDEDGNGADPG